MVGESGFLERVEVVGVDVDGVAGEDGGRLDDAPVGGLNEECGRARDYLRARVRVEARIKRNNLVFISFLRNLK